MLPRAEKLKWFDRLIRAAQAMPDPRDRAAALSGIGMALGTVDPQRSLRVHWEELLIARQLGLKPDAWHDVVDQLGTAFPLATPDEIFRFTFLNASGKDDEIVKVLWGFAKKLDTGDDRDATLEALGRMLIKSGDYSRAAGAASLIESPVRQARLVANILAAQLDKDSNQCP